MESHCDLDAMGEMDKNASETRLMQVYLSMGKTVADQEKSSRERAVAVFRRCAGMLRTKDALKAGIHPRTLYNLRDEGVIECLSRGLYRLTDAIPLASPDLVAVVKRVPGGVICLISALAHYELTTQIPHEVYLAIQRNAEAPRIDYPPVRVFWFTGKAFSEGIETHRLDGIPVRIYGREKTLADCFKYRNKIGMDTVLESLRLYKEQRRTNVDALLKYAEVCRVAKVMRPYLESIL
jgi:predicted transcriptional regulator of viral defense system